MDDHFLTQVGKLAAIGRAQDLQFDGVVARVTVDQFCALPRPTQVEIDRFTAVMAEALPRTDAASAARIAGKLAHHPATPEIVLAQLVERGPDAACLVFRNAPRLSTSLLLMRAETGGSAEAAAIGGRRDLDPPVVAALARRAEPEALRALAANSSAHISKGSMLALIQRGRFDAALARALLSRADLGLDALPLFLSADCGMRRQLILETRRAELASLLAVTPPLAAVRQAALSAASAANRNAFATAIALRLKSGRAAIQCMIDDPGGEPLALILAAAGADQSVAADAMAMLQSGHAPTTRPNVRLALETTPNAAWRIVSAIVGRRGASRSSEFGKDLRSDSADARNGAASRPQLDIAKISRG